MINDRFNAPRRKPTRLKNYDYSNNGLYYVTIRIKETFNALSVVEKGKLTLLKNGEIIQNEINKINDKENCKICHYVIMPDHIHLILLINNKDEKNSKIKLTQIIGGFKSITTKLINKEEDALGRKIWQRSFHDHIIRNDEDFQIKWKYIENNPMKWYIENIISND